MVDYVGTVKLHGCNTSIVSRVDEPLQFQSRNRILTAEHDTFKFRSFCLGKVDILEQFFDELRAKLPNSHTIVIYGEFCGPKIQRRVTISKCETSWIIFNVKTLSTHWESAPRESWRDLKNEQGRIFNICDYPTYHLRVNLLRLEESIEESQKMAEKVGRNCPVARAMGKPGEGEGIVWIPEKLSDFRFWFKSKSEKHSVASAKPYRAKLNRAPPAIHQEVRRFVEENLTESRLEGSLCQLSELGLSMERNLGRFLQLLVSDVIREEGGELSDDHLKSARKMLSERGRIWYFSNLKQRPENTCSRGSESPSNSQHAKGRAPQKGYAQFLRLTAKRSLEESLGTQICNIEVGCIDGTESHSLQSLMGALLTKGITGDCTIEQSHFRSLSFIGGFVPRESKGNEVGTITGGGR